MNSANPRRPDNAFVPTYPSNESKNPASIKRAFFSKNCTGRSRSNATHSRRNAAMAVCGPRSTGRREADGAGHRVGRRKDQPILKQPDRKPHGCPQRESEKCDADEKAGHDPRYEPGAGRGIVSAGMVTAKLRN